MRGYSLASGLGEELTAICRKHLILQIVPKVLKLSKILGRRFQEGNRWRTVMNTAVNLGIPRNQETFLTR
jgi:hypothetical protein